jgi:hypothetical protein
MTDTPPDWVLIEAAKRIGWENLPLDVLEVHYSRQLQAFHALCDMILKHEQPPVDRKLLCAREAYATPYDDVIGQDLTLSIAIRAIELWIEGYGA